MGATLLISASFHLKAHKHHLSPSFNPSKPYCGSEVVRSFPTLFENDKNFWQQNNDKVVADFCFFKCLVFAKQNLKKNDYNTFKKNFNHKMEKIKIPSLVIFLTKNFRELEQQIKKRDRSFEREIKLTYLKKLEKGYHLIINNFEYYPASSLISIKLDVGLGYILISVSWFSVSMLAN